MEKRHKYDYRVNPDDENHVATKIVRMVGSGRRVMEIGAGPGSITRLLKDNGACAVSAVEVDPEALPHLAPLCERVFQRDLNDPTWTQGVSIAGGYEVIVAADVLEHLLDPWSTLAALRPLLAAHGHVVVSLPHAGHNALIAALLNEDFRYYDWGLLDRTHIRFFGLKNIDDLFSRAGYAIVEFDYVFKPPKATELADLWDALPRKTQRALAESEYGDVYQVVVKARARTASMPEGLHLVPPKPAPKQALGRLKTWLRPWLPAPVRRVLVRTLSVLGIKN
jgi:SAM-dependent methyltransferase